MQLWITLIYIPFWNIEMVLNGLSKKIFNAQVITLQLSCVHMHYFKIRVFALSACGLVQEKRPRWSLGTWLLTIWFRETRLKLMRLTTEALADEPYNVALVRSSRMGKLITNVAWRLFWWSWLCVTGLIFRSDLRFSPNNCQNHNVWVIFCCA